MVVNAIPTIDLQPIAEQKLCVGGTSIPLAVTYTGGAGTASYQWHENFTESNSGGTAIAGATTPSYTPNPFTSAGIRYYYVELKLSGNNCGSVPSNVAKVIVVDDPTITTQPFTPQTVCQTGVPTALKVEAKNGRRHVPLPMVQQHNRQQHLRKQHLRCYRCDIHASFGRNRQHVLLLQKSHKMEWDVTRPATQRL